MLLYRLRDRLDKLASVGIKAPPQAKSPTPPKDKPPQASLKMPSVKMPNPPSPPKPKAPSPESTLQSASLPSLFQEVFRAPENPFDNEQESR